MGYNNVYGVVDDNNNYYRNMFMDVMRMNHGHINQCSIIDEELNTDATMFFDLFKYSNKLLWDGCTITVNYWLLHKCSPQS